MRRLALSLCFVLILPALSYAYNNNYEQRVARQLAENYEKDEVVWLRAAGRDFLSLYKGYTRNEARGAVIILHGMGAHPDWPDVIRPLRHALPEKGWATLSLHLPVLAPEAPIEDYGQTVNEAKERIRAAIRQLKKWNFHNIVLAGHSFGAASGAHALSAGDMTQISAFIGISMQAQQFLSPRLNLLKQLEAIDIPVLDIYGSRDVLEVSRDAADRRLAASKNGNSAYQQLRVDGADHYYRGVEEVLHKRIQGWLSRTIAAQSPGTGKAERPANDAKQESADEE